MLFGIFNFLARNPIAQAIAGVLGFLIFWKTNNAYQRRKGRVQGRLEVSEAVNEKTNEIIRKWKMLAGSLMLLVVTNCAALPEPVVTIAEPLCDQIQPIEYSMRDKDGDFESRENIYDTDETAIKIFRPTKHTQHLSLIHI